MEYQDKNKSETMEGLNTDKDREELLSFTQAIARGRKNPVFFGEYFLGLQFHPGQKIWLWLTTKTRIKDAYELAMVIGTPLPSLEQLLVHEFLKNILCPSNRFGKEQPISEPVLTENGFKPIGEIKIGDKIYTKDGTLTEVDGVYPQGKKDVYKFIFNDGSWTRVGLEHLWEVITPNNRFTKVYNNKDKRGKDEYVNKNYRKFSILTTKQIIDNWGVYPKVGNRIEIPMVEPIQFPEKKTLIDPYILGLLLGDGGMSSNSVTFSTSDIELIESIGNYKKKTGNNYDYSILGLAGKLRELKLLGKNSQTKFIPKEYLYNSVENRISLLQGLLDTDGCFNKNGVIEYVTISPQLASAIKFLVQSLGGQVVIAEKYPTYTYKGEKKKGKKAYRITIRIKINPFRLKCKKKLFDDFKYYTTKNRILIKIEKLGKEKSVCIQVEHPSQLYITRDFIVTHNTLVTAVKHIWYNFYKIGAKGSPRLIHDVRYSTLNLSPHSLQVDAAYRYVIDFFDEKFVYTWNGEQTRNKCLIKDFLIDHRQIKRELIFANNSSIKGVPTGEDQASSLAGTQFMYISYDEAPQSRHLREELPAKIQSRLIDSGGPLDIIGTPEVDKPSHTYYQRITKYGTTLNKGFFTLQGKLADNFFIGEEERTKTLKSIKETDPEKYRQVAFGDFITSGAKLFDNAVIENIWEGETFLQQGIPGRNYIIGIDWGFSDTGDPTAMYVIDYTNLNLLLEGRLNIMVDPILYRIVFREVIKGGSPYEVLARARVLQKDFNDGLLVHDSSSMGGVIIKKMLREMNVSPIYDFTNSRSPKDEMLFILVRALTYNRRTETLKNGKIKELVPIYGKLRSPIIPSLEEQLGGYHIEDKKLEQDEIMALGMPIWYLEKKLAHHKTKVFDINLLASTPEEILKVPGCDNKAKQIGIREFKIRERII